MDFSRLKGQYAYNYRYIDISDLISQYYENDVQQAVKFGTSGHRGSSIDGSFNQYHIISLCLAVIDYRKANNIIGPIFLGKDTHALSDCALKTAIRVFATQHIDMLVAHNFAYTPTPVISRHIVSYNQEHEQQADGIIFTPSHNPPKYGGFKYNPPQGGGAAKHITKFIEQRANFYLENECNLRFITYKEALNSPYLHFIDMRFNYVKDLKLLIDFETIKHSGLKAAINPQGGASLEYFDLINEIYGIDLEIVNRRIDPAFAFMPFDFNGQVRMDCTSIYTMRPLIELKDSYDLLCALDPDADRHGFVDASGLVSSDKFMPCMLDYLLNNFNYKQEQYIGKNFAASMLIDKITDTHGYKLYETPTGFKWFANLLYENKMPVAMEDSAGACFYTRDNKLFTSDKDGISVALLACQMCAASNKSLSMQYDELCKHYGQSYYKRLDISIDSGIKDKIKKCAKEASKLSEFAGSKVIKVQTQASGNQESLGGVKLVTTQGFFAIRASGTEDIYKIYAQSLQSPDHLEEIIKEANDFVASL